MVISIHAPARGATDDVVQHEDVGVNFNPRTREGCDARAHPREERTAGFQSTHPRGVRPQSRCRRMRRTHFNPRTREGCDDMRYDILGSTDTFQSTHPRGVRHRLTKSEKPSIIFQSTHPRGVRLHTAAFGTSCAGISIHAPARGATLNDPIAPRPSYHFNPRTREGCDSNR